MRSRLLLSVILSMFLLLSVTAQIPQGFNYQAVARDASGSPVASASLQVRITILMLAEQQTEQVATISPSSPDSSFSSK